MYDGVGVHNNAEAIGIISDAVKDTKTVPAIHLVSLLAQRPLFSVSRLLFIFIACFSSARLSFIVVQGQRSPPLILHSDFNRPRTYGLNAFIANQAK